MVEMFSLIARREFQQDISLTSANRRRQAFLYHAANDYDVIQITHQTFIQSRDLVTRHAAFGLRTLDALATGVCPDSAHCHWTLDRLHQR